MAVDQVTQPEAPRAKKLAPKDLAEAFKSFPRFCALLKIADQTTGAQIPLRLTGIQRAYNARRTNRDIILKSRKVFFTTLELARDLWWFLTKRGARVIIVCQSEDDHSLRDAIADNLRTMLASLREHVDIKLDIENMLRLARFKTDANLRIIEAGATVGTARKRGRGIAVNRLHATEVAAWEHGGETLTVLLNAMPQDGSGEAVLESTPLGASGYYYERWKAATEGRGNFKAQFFPWFHHEKYRTELEPGETILPEDDEEKRLAGLGVPAEAIKWRRLQIADQGPQKVAQEYPGDPHTCFLVSGRGFFDGMALDRLLQHAKDPIAVDPSVSSGSSGQSINDRLVPAVRIWHQPLPGESYVVGSDTSDGTGGSAGTGIVIERRTGRHMATLWGQFRPWVLARHLASVGRYFNDADLAVERNNTGLTVLRALEAEEKYGNVMVDYDGRPGLVTSSATRGPMLDTLEEAVRTGAFVTNDVHLVGEMRTFVVTITESRERPEHAKGARDDLVLGTAIAWDAACRRRTRRELGNLPAR
jgi:hypothetical protein